MSVLEIKGEILQMVANTKDEELLKRINSAIKELIQDESSDDLEELSAEQKSRLDVAIEQSLRGEGIPHEAVKQKYAKWGEK